MKNTTYTYSLLKYQHSQILGEVLNIGVLVYFHQQQQLYFLYPDKLIRLRFAYPNVQDKTIRNYFRAFEFRIGQLNKQPEFFAENNLQSSLKKFIDTELLPSDSSSLQFAEPKTALSYHTEVTKTLDQLYNLYFSVFEHDLNTYKRIDESVLLSKYKNLIKELDKKSPTNTLDKIQFDYIVKQSENQETKFDIAWKSTDTLHLVKPISFDVKKPQTIRNKAFRFFGEFSTLEDIAINNRYSYDLLISRPTSKELFKNYDEAIKLISQPKHCNIIEDSDLTKYSEQTIRSLTLF